ncbi:ATP-dependent dethiobiotin synthetase BioD [Actinomycetospora sp. NBRC 106375]|uniref:dethiobiotin synthase n=1 Tax=Actinomycetospora sp. NBRC 106375 TaxID=3032207 RepID=UPI0024A4A7ED|nr:dethiobiotin synthase [Actinomycetospora sp. NBRC 106375]GLZ47336.1 ATP-dependent dethiobiotin synthetase BioD [Actinomycetospora sp. NBRC 106375]
MRTLIVTGTGTGVGKTVVTAAIAALARAAGERVTVVKPTQTGVAPGEDGDLADVARLAGPVGTVELARFPEPLAPATAARRAGAMPVMAAQVVAAVRGIDADLVIVEGAGGLLVRFNDGAETHPPETLADVAAALDAPVVLVASAGLGVLNTAALTAEVLGRRGITLGGTVVGAYPDQPDLAARTNLDDLPAVTGAPLLGVLPAGLGTASPDALLAAARCGLGPVLGGGWSPDRGA